MTLLNRKIAPQFHQVNNIEFLQPISYNLDNGINVNTLSGGSQDIVKIDFIFKAGNWFQKQIINRKRYQCFNKRRNPILFCF